MFPKPKQEIEDFSPQRRCLLYGCVIIQAIDFEGKLSQWMSGRLKLLGGWIIEPEFSEHLYRYPALYQCSARVKMTGCSYEASYFY